MQHKFACCGEQLCSTKLYNGLILLYNLVCSHLQDQHVTILHVDGGSIAELSGICSGDIIQSIGLVNQDQMDKFEFKDVTKQKHVTSVLNTQSPTVIGSVLIIERFKMSYV